MLTTPRAAALLAAILANGLLALDARAQITRIDLDVVESPAFDGESFGENAAIKATRTARVLGHWTLGEDSGLCVDALDGAPGIYSARFSGEDASDLGNNRLLIERLVDVPEAKREARRPVRYFVPVHRSAPHFDQPPPLRPRQPCGP